MNRLLTHIERMTSERERPLLEVALTEALLDRLEVSSVSVVKVMVTPEEVFVWPAVISDSTGSQLHDDGLSLPEEMISIEYHPLLDTCLKTGITQESGNDTVIPIVKADGTWFGFVEIAGRALNANETGLVTSLTTIFTNMLALLDYSEVDTLTGLLNRKTFDEYLMKILSSLSVGDDSRLEARHLPLRRKHRSTVQDHWLGVLDIDFFKRINDNFGHLIGDEVLLLVATMMKGSFRVYDKLFRFGGEEFVVLLKPTEDSNAQVAFERFRAEMEAREFPQVGRVTISIGFARIGPKDQPSRIIDNADEALYWAKEHGRNQVVNYEALLAAGLLEKKEQTSDVELF